jgi:hypothetical protein
MFTSYSRYKIRKSIKSLTIHMAKPRIGTNTIERGPFDGCDKHIKLIQGEYLLRKSAYKDSTIDIDKSFFDDSDMNSDYYLIIIYFEGMSLPLLTARYYFNKDIISEVLNQGYENIPFEEKKISAINSSAILKELVKGNVFLIDRLSANKSSKVYRLYREYIFMKLCLELVFNNRRKILLAMARRDKHEKLLAKYLHLGLRIIGLINHKGKEHWILQGDLHNGVSNLRKATIINVLFLFKLFYKNRYGK